MSRFNITLLFSDSTNPRELWSLEPPTFQKFWTSMLLRAFLMFGISLLKLRKLCRKTPCLERFVAGACQFRGLAKGKGSRFNEVGIGNANANVVIYCTCPCTVYGGLQFFLVGEIGRRPVKAPLAAAISRQLIPATRYLRCKGIQTRFDLTVADMSAT